MNYEDSLLDESVCKEIDEVLASPELDLQDKILEAERLRRTETDPHVFTPLPNSRMCAHCDQRKDGKIHIGYPVNATPSIWLRDTIPCAQCLGHPGTDNCVYCHGAGRVESYEARQRRIEANKPAIEMLDEWIAKDAATTSLLLRYDNLAESIGGELGSSKVANLERWVNARRDTVTLLKNLEQLAQRLHKNLRQDCPNLALADVLELKNILCRAIYQEEENGIVS